MPKIKLNSTSGQNQHKRYKKGKFRLHKAVILGKLKRIENFFVSGENMNQLNKKGNTPLHLAIIHNKPKVVKTLLDLGASIYSFDRKMRYPFHLAAVHDRMDILETLIKFGARINDCDMSGNTALHMATTHGSLNTIKLLLDYGANPKYPNHDGDTPLHLAVAQGKENILKMLIQYKGSVNEVNGCMYSPLHTAAIGNNCDIIRTLILSGAYIDALDNNNNTPLQLAADYNNFEAAEALIQLGASIDCRNIAGKTALYMAILHDNAKLVEILIQSTKDIDHMYYDGYSPFDIALLYCKPKVLQKLILEGASKEQGSKQYENLTHKTSHSYIISRYMQKAFIEAFKKLKSDSNEKKTPGNISTDSSLMEKDIQLLQRLLGYNVSLSDLLETVKTFIKCEILHFGEKSKWVSTKRRCEIYPSLLPYLENCFKEVSCMSNKIIHEGITFNQFVTKVANSVLLQQSSLAQDYINHILDIQFTNAYPIYRDIIASQVQKHFLKQELLKYVFYTRISNRKKICVDSDSVSVLSDYLSNLDILNLILAVSDKK